MYPAFTDEFGVEVESVSQPTSEVWVVQLQQAIAAGGAPADVSMLSGGLAARDQRRHPREYQTSDIPTSTNLAEGYVRTDDEDNVTGVGGLSWYITIVSNTDRVKESPDTWSAFWDPGGRTSGRPPQRGQLVPARDHGGDVLRRLRHPRDPGRRPRGDAQAPGGQAERAPVVPGRGAGAARVQRGRGVARAVLPRHHAMFAASEAGGSNPLRSVFPTEARSWTRVSGRSRRRPRTSAPA